jgi:hypothetical protein
MTLAHGVGHKKYTPLTRNSFIDEALGLDVNLQAEASVDELKLMIKTVSDMQEQIWARCRSS